MTKYQSAANRKTLIDRYIKDILYLPIAYEITLQQLYWVQITTDVTAHFAD